MTKKRILVFIDWFYPGDRAGGPIRSIVNMIDQLGDEYDFSVITRNTDYMSDKVYDGIKSDEWNKVDGNKRVYYFSREKLTRENMASIIAKEKFDIVYLNGMWSIPFTIWPLRTIDKKKTKVILGVRGMLAPSAMAIRSAKKKIFLLYAKARGFYSGIVFHATTEQEAAEVKEYFGASADVRVAANLPRKIRSTPKQHAVKNETLRIVSIARIAPEKNTLFAIQALVHLECNVLMDLYGTVYDEGYMQQCSDLVRHLPSNVKVEFHDALPSDKIEETISRYDLLFLPSRGENFGHVIIEAMQASTPVLISDRTPWKELEKKKAGWELPLNDPEKELSGFREGAFALAKKYSEDPSLLEATRKLFS